jgi:hypothetical protein
MTDMQKIVLASLIVYLAVHFDLWFLWIYFALFVFGEIF